MPDIFIDCSGTAGKRSCDADSIWVTLAAVSMANISATEEIIDVFRQYRTYLPKTQREFKSTKSEVVNRRLLQALLTVRSWSYLCVVGCKPRLKGRLERPAECQRWFVKMALKFKLHSLKDGAVYIDNTTSQNENIDLLHSIQNDKVLRSYAAIRNSNCIDSTDHYGVQFADLIAGLVNDKYNHPDCFDMELYKKVRYRETVVWMYPEDSENFDNEALKLIPVVRQEKFKFYSN